MRSLLPLASLSLVTLALSGCPSWEERSYFDRLAWSEDDEQIVAIELRFEEAPPSDPLQGTTQKRNFRHQLYVGDADGSNLTPVGDERPGQSGAELYLMRVEGYAILSRVLDDGSLAFDHVDLETGTYTELPDPGFDAAEAYTVPGPDGARLVQVGIEGTTVEARFYDPATLEPEGDVVELTFTNGLDYTFRPDSVFVVSDGTTAKAVVPGQEPEDTDVPGCMSPKTASSDVSSSGERLVTDGEGNITTEAAGPEASFGCQ